MARKILSTLQIRKFPGAGVFHTPSNLAPDMKGEPCPSARKGCPVQLVWKSGQPYLRFCRAKRKPGFLVPVKDPSDALAKSKEICACWVRSKKNFKTCVPAGSGLGKIHRKRKRR